MSLDFFIEIIYGISFVASNIYIFTMIFMLYFLFCGKTRKQFQYGVDLAMVSLAMAFIGLLCHLLTMDGWLVIGDIVKIAGPMVNLWSLGRKMDALPMTEAERFEAEALRELREL